MSFISWRNSCEYVTDFEPVKQAYTKAADNDPEDVFSTQVVLKTEPRIDSLQSLMVQCLSADLQYRAGYGAGPGRSCH